MELGRSPGIVLAFASLGSLMEILSWGLLVCWSAHDDQVLWLWLGVSVALFLVGWFECVFGLRVDWRFGSGE